MCCSARFGHGANMMAVNRPRTGRKPSQSPCGWCRHQGAWHVPLGWRRVSLAAHQASSRPVLERPRCAAGRLQISACVSFRSTLSMRFMRALGALLRRLRRWRPLGATSATARRMARVLRVEAGSIILTGLLHGYASGVARKGGRNRPTMNKDAARSLRGVRMIIAPRSVSRGAAGAAALRVSATRRARRRHRPRRGWR
jgi:hypothetical protein